MCATSGHRPWRTEGGGPRPERGSGDSEGDGGRPVDSGKRALGGQQKADALRAAEGGQHKAPCRQRKPGALPTAQGILQTAERGAKHSRPLPSACHPEKPSLGISRSALASSSTLTSLNVTTRTFFTNRAGRYMSHTHASCIFTSKNTSPFSAVRTSRSTEFVR